MKFRPFRFIFKVIIGLIFTVYIFVGAGSAIKLYQQTMNRKLPLSALNGVIDRAQQTGEPNAVTKWVRLRPISETDELIAIVTPKSAYMEPSMFFEFSRRQLQNDHAGDALFWAQLGRYRLRYDALRCQVPDGYKVLDEILETFKLTDVENMLRKDPTLLKKSIRQVLDFDEKYPAHNNPAFICNIIMRSTGITAPPMPEQEWEREHRSLRTSTEFFLKTPDTK